MLRVHETGSGVGASTDPLEGEVVFQIAGRTGFPYDTARAMRRNDD